MNWKTVAYVAVSLILTASSSSCNKVKPSYNRENLKGTWVADIFDGVTADPYRWTVQTYEKNGAMTLYGVKDAADGNRTWGSASLSYESYCCDFFYKGKISGLLGIPVTANIYRNYSFISSEDSLATLEMISEKVNDEIVVSDHNTVTMRKLNKTYAKTDSLLGIWQTHTRNGEEFTPWRMMFESSGKFTMYTEDAGGRWNPIGDGSDTYLVYSDFIVLTLKNNPFLGKSDATEVTFFTNMKAYPKSSIMFAESGGYFYTFTYVSSL